MHICSYYLPDVLSLSVHNVMIVMSVHYWRFAIKICRANCFQLFFFCYRVTGVSTHYSGNFFTTVLKFVYRHMRLGHLFESVAVSRWWTSLSSPARVGIVETCLGLETVSRRIFSVLVLVLILRKISRVVNISWSQTSWVCRRCFLIEVEWIVDVDLKRWIATLWNRPH